MDLESLDEKGPATDIAVSLAHNGVAQVYVTQPAHQVAGVRWQNGFDPFSPWEGWHCFGVVPLIDRISATRLGNSFPVIIASSSDGRLWSRFTFENGGPWMPLTAPPGKGRIDDLEFVAMDGEVNRLYAVRSGRIFTRRAATSYSYASLGPWHEIGAFEVRAIAACRVDVHRDRVFIATADAGWVYSKEIDVESPSDDGWARVPGEFHDVAALDCFDDGQGDVRLYLADASGDVRLSFAPFESASVITHHTFAIDALDVLEIPNSDDPLLVVIDGVGNAYRWRTFTHWQE